MTAPRVGIVMGSRSDLGVMQLAAEALVELGVDHDVQVVSAHRTPEAMFAYGRGAAADGRRVLIAGAGGAAHLPGMLAAVTTLPVIGVPVPLRHLDGLDSLLSMVQMPSGILAARILAQGDPTLTGALVALAERMAADATLISSGSAAPS